MTGKRTVSMLLSFVLMLSVFVHLPQSSKADAQDAADPYTWRNVVTGGGGGFMPGIIFNPTEPDLIYARADIGGAYRWNPQTSSWIPLTDFVGWDDWNNNGIDALATDPVDPNRVYLAAGTYTNDWTSHNGYIMRSTDRGDSWELTELPFKVGGNMPGRSMGERLVVDPNDNRILFFGARSGNGLWKSTDYGATWSKVTSFPNPGTYIEDPSNSYQNDIVGLAWITFDPTTGSPGQATQTIYVGVADLDTSVYRSTDGGQTWHAVPGQPTGYLPHHGVLSSEGYLYIPYSNGAGPYDGTKGEVWRFNTATGQWTDISPVSSSSEDNYYGYGGFAVDAQQPGTIMVATLNSWWPDAIIFRSTDRGETWTRIWDWDGYPSRSMRYTLDISAAPWLDFGQNPSPPEVSPKLGWMIGDLEIDPFNSDRMMYVTGATIYGTNNLTEWDHNRKIQLQVMAKGIEETAVFDLISPPSGPQLISVQGDVTGFRHDDITQPPQKMMVNPNSSSDIDYAGNTPNFLVRVGYGDQPNQSIGFSHDYGANWYYANSGPAGTKGGGKVALSANGNSVVWSTPDVGVHYSKTGGNSWAASSGIPANATIAADRVTEDKFYGFAAGIFYVSTDGGATFSATTAAGLPSEGEVDLRTMPGVAGDIWLAGGSETGVYGLWHSTNSGQSFTKLSNVQEADFIGFGKAAPGQSYMALYTVAQIGGKRGFFRSDDAGQSWVRINDDQHQYARVTTITGDPRIYGRVYIGTNGRGIVYGDPSGGSVEPPEPTDPRDSTIQPTTATFDKNPLHQGDIQVTMNLNGNQLTGIKNGAATLLPDTDYEAAGNLVTIHRSYLANLATGTSTLTFEFNAGAAALLTITIIDTSDSGGVEPPAGDLKVEYRAADTNASDNHMKPHFRIVNTGSADVPLVELKLRYYYTLEGNQSQQFHCDYAVVGCSNIQGSHVKMDTAAPGADHYLELSFIGGTLAAGTHTGEIQTRNNKVDWSNYDESNDYSYDPTKISFTEWNRVALYRNGSLVWGIEP